MEQYKLYVVIQMPLNYTTKGTNLYILLWDVVVGKASL